MSPIIAREWALYNEIDEYAAEWIENLIRLGAIAPGIVDRRSIVDICPDELRGFRQVHFFAGIGVWSYSLRRAGVSDDTALWTGSCPCFTAGTLILTDAGLLPIEEVTIRHRVWTHAGNWQRVLRVGSDWKPVGDLIGQGHFGLTCTHDHPFYGMSRSIHSTHQEGKAVRIHKVSDPDWIAAKDMPGKWWAMPKQYPQQTLPTVEGFTSYELALLSGLYVGDGWLGADGRSDRLILGVNETKYAEILGLLPNLHFQTSRQRTTVRMELKSAPLVAYLRESFSEKSCSKVIPSWMLSASQEFKEAFLLGWDLTDGTRAKMSGSRRITTASRSLAIMGRMLLVSMGFSAQLRKIETPPKAIIECREVNQSNYYVLSRSKNCRYKMESDGKVWFKAKKFKPSNVIRRVFNIEVENDNSYLADGIFVHNCQPFSAAGKGDGFADERHLWPAFFHLIQNCRPPRIYGEQVASKDGLGWLDLVFADLEASDYTVWAVDTPSAGSGAPHIQQRLRFCADDTRSSAGRLQHTSGDGWQQRWAEPSGRGFVSGCGIDGMEHGNVQQQRSTGDNPGVADLGRSSTSDGLEHARNNGLQGRLHRWSDAERGTLDRQTGRDCTIERMADAHGRDTSAERQQRGWEQRQQPQDGGSSERMADSCDGASFGGVTRSVVRGLPTGARQDVPHGLPGPTNGFWRDADWLFCRDGKWRPIEPGTFPLVDGAAFRVGSGSAFEGKSRQGMLKGYGNAIDAEATVDFIEATLEPDTIDTHALRDSTETVPCQSPLRLDKVRQRDLEDLA